MVALPFGSKVSVHFMTLPLISHGVRQTLAVLMACHDHLRRTPTGIYVCQTSLTWPTAKARPYRENVPPASIRRSPSTMAAKGRRGQESVTERHDNNPGRHGREIQPNTPGLCLTLAVTN